jgi:xanthine dehydrogenase accessory factor
MQRILSRTIQSLEQGEPAVWATVTAQSGSAPRGAGSRMLLLKGPEILGSVGGGFVEAKSIEIGLSLLDKPGQKIFPLSLTGKQVAEADMICGGQMEVFVETIPLEALTFLKTLENAVSGLGTVVLLTLVSETPLSYDERHLLWENEEPIAGMLSVSDNSAATLKDVIAGDKPDLLSLPGQADRLYIEPIQRPSAVHIFGGGHVSLDVAWFAHRVGFEVVIIDDREEFANRERFPMAAEIRALSFEEAFKGAVFGPRDYVVIVTRGHLHDLVVLRRALEQSPAYIGMIGSRRKKAMIYEQLLKEGVSKEKLDGVYAPIGLDIRAETPEELGISIVGELIEVRSRGN